MTKNMFIVYFFTLLILSACDSIPAITSNPTTYPIDTIQPVNTVSPVNSSTPVLVSVLTNKCIEIKTDGLPELKGKIVLATGDNTDYALLDLETGKALPIAASQSKYVVQSSVSPNGEKYAYLLDSKANFPQVHELVISTFNGKKTKIPWQNGWITWNWLDNERLIIGKADNRFGSYMTIDVNSGQTEEMPLNSLDKNSVFPSVYHYIDLDNQQDETSFAELFFDPTLTRVIHFGFSHDEVNSEGTLLRDLSNGKVLARLDNILNIPTFSASEISYPVWAPDGKSFLIEASSSSESRDLYQVSYDGKITRLTYLTNSFDQVRIRNYSFSPDQKYVAFWLLTNQYKEYHLAILDTITAEITDTCIQGYADNTLYVPFSPFWAPNSHQFVISTTQMVNVETTFTIWVDLDQSIAVQVIENMTPRGWLVSP
ncbi:MAG: hypothetical protein HZB50_03880 [Chloroflexi bacterium]|nr:hypothetical protein [Chloroflexota bacterium]